MATDPWTPTDLFYGLPPQLQGVFVVVAAGVVGYLAWRKYISHSRGESPTVTDYAVGDPTSFADLTPVRRLAKNVEDLTTEMRKGEAARNELVINSADLLKKCGELVDMFANHLAELRDEREEAELDRARREGFESGVNSRPSRRPSRRRVPKPKPSA